MLLMLASSAHGAAQRSVHLSYAAPASCPDQSGFEAMLAARLGYAPNAQVATHEATVAVREAGQTLEATFSVWEREGRKRGEKSFTAGLQDCQALLGSVALALAIALDPQLLVRRPAPQPSPPQPSEKAALLAPASVVVTTATERSPLVPALAAVFGVRGSMGLLPAMSVGPSLEVRLQLGRISLAGEFETLVAPTVASNGGAIESSLARGGLQFCGHAAWALLCIRGTGGAVQAAGRGFETNRRGTHGLLTAGPVVGARWNPVAGLLLQATAGLDFVLLRTSILLGMREVWNSPLLDGNLTVSVGWRFQ